ncbi:NAD(P)-dependent dehydrogenase (short-subunit alcohol dehydrogenase family) [Micromonospora luteifusca]|uniref:NAD(P)-dependent dehydrogenase (Short-subunit alcohol dehydrogenase family) n=1 Tax=Micromonospora luteifusca TaxID=709860 RepID=A0ABS2LLJ3_9ACTN|nr:SDR family oxidoreductase [Micromonospora luteifusca]MBM7489059.1 NAD(P)-dependent dehydrogenase (short-subunit alcohol dehydrogenase family) [Micromonospora luteifusca]
MDAYKGRLVDRVAIVTGASRGIGLAIAQRLVAEGARVGLTARRPEALADAVAALGGPEYAIAVPGRADDPEHRAAAVQQVGAAFGPVDLLVNNTGINPVHGPLVGLDLAAARKILDVNVVAALGWVQEVCAAGMAERGGCVVNVSSISALGPSPGIAFYGVSKAALNLLTASLAVELGPAIRVNAVAPGVVKTRFAAALYEGREDEVAARYPLGRLGLPPDVAGAVAFLASDDAGWITGQTIVCDGGVSLSGRAG